MLVLSALVTALIAPLGTACALGLAGLALAPTRFRKLAWLLGAAAVLWLWLWATPVASHALRGQLEKQFPLLPVAQLPVADAIVVLGGGISPSRPGYPLPNLHGAADRVWHAARLYHAGKAPLLVLSGGSDPQRHATSEAAAMQQLLEQMGVPASAMLLEDTSRNTSENARNTAQLLNNRGLKRVLLVTSALHMPRALPLFEAQGLQTTAAATDHEADDFALMPTGLRWLPSSDALEGSGRALKELVGRAVGR
jgi:uncharacterized SAM-binding protein YcdF (DUF218 family)